MPKAYIYFDIAFVVVLVSLLVQGWSIDRAARLFNVALPRADAPPTRVELDLPGQLEQELVGYRARSKSLYLRRDVIPTWAKLALVVRNERVLSPVEAGEIIDGDYVYFLAPPGKAQALDRFFVDAPAPRSPDEGLLGDFYLSGDATLGALGEIYGLSIAAEETTRTLADHFLIHIGDEVRIGDSVEVGAVRLIADQVDDGRVVTVGLDLAKHGDEESPRTLGARFHASVQNARARLRAAYPKVGE
jgi:cell volume regulation protein A